MIKAMLEGPQRKTWILSAVLLVGVLILLALPTGFQQELYRNAEEVKAKVLATNQDNLYQTGLVFQGEQRCQLKILEGRHKGETIEGVQLLTGSISHDTVFEEGDLAYVVIEHKDDGSLLFATLVDRHRLGPEAFLMALFAGLLILVTGSTGLRTILSFSLTLLSIWKLLIPALLRGYSPVWVALGIGALITVSTLLLVGGFNRKSYSAIAASMGAALVTFVLAILFTRVFGLHGTVMEASEGLLHAGFFSLDLTAIFQSAMYLSCAGAVMDMSIDIASALEELHASRPELASKELFAAGMRIGRQVVGTQTTTLLLAYIGNYLAHMMVYMAQGTSLTAILTSRMISAEILATFVGCIGIVLVSPLTSLCCAWSMRLPEKAL